MDLKRWLILVGVGAVVAFIALSYLAGYIRVRRRENRVIKVADELAERYRKEEDLGVVEVAQVMMARGLNEEESKTCLELIDMKLQGREGRGVDAALEPLVAKYQEKFANAPPEKWKSISQEMAELDITDEQRLYLAHRLAELSKQ